MPSRTFARVLGVIAFSSLLALNATARDRHSRNVSTRGHEPAANCNDLKIEFDGRSAVVQSEERTVTKAEAPTLRATGETNGGVQVTGWNVESDALFGAPPVTVVVGDEAHPTLMRSLSMAGFGHARVLRLPVDGQGRILAEGNVHDYNEHRLVHKDRAHLLDSA